MLFWSVLDQQYLAITGLECSGRTKNNVVVCFRTIETVPTPKGLSNTIFISQCLLDQELYTHVTGDIHACDKKNSRVF